MRGILFPICFWWHEAWPTDDDVSSQGFPTADSELHAVSVFSEPELEHSLCVLEGSVGAGTHSQKLTHKEMK